MTGRAKGAIAALAACAGVGAAVTAAGPAGGQTAEVGGYGVVFEYGRGGARGIVHAVRRPGAPSVRVTISLHGLEAGSSYRLATTRRRTCGGRVLWSAAFSTKAGADDAFARLRVPLEPDAATGAGGAGLYLVTPDGDRERVACAAGRRYRSG